MRLNSISYCVKNVAEAKKLFEECFGYKEIEISENLITLEPPEKTMHTAPTTFGEVWFNWNDAQLGGFINYHLAPEIVIFEDKQANPGIHHLSYEVSNLDEVMKEWEFFGVKFQGKPLQDKELRKIFTEVNPYTGIIYELIERTDKGFCKENVKNLMESTK